MTRWCLMSLYFSDMEEAFTALCSNSGLCCETVSITAWPAESQHSFMWMLSHLDPSLYWSAASGETCGQVR